MTVRNWLGGSGDFSVPGNWDTGTPGTLDSASFNAGTYTATLDTPVTIDSLFGGSGNATLEIVAGGTLVLREATNIGFWNGVLAQTGGTLSVQSGYLQSSGTIVQTAGTIVLGAGVRITEGSGTATYDGTLAGGTLAVGGSTTLNNAVLALAAIAMGSTGTLVLASDESFAGDDMIANGSLVLGGHALTLSGDSTQTGGQIIGPGTIALTSGTLNLSGGIIVRGAGAIMIDSGLINDDTGLALSNASGDSVTLEITAAGTYDILDDRTMSAFSNAGTTYGTIVNQGLLEKTAAITGLRATEGAMLVNTGTLLVAIGTLLLSGTGNQLGGTLEGAGTVLIGGTATLEPGVVVGAGSAIMTLAVGYGGTLLLGGSGNNYVLFADFGAGNNSTLALAGNTLTIQGAGSLDGTVLGGGGTMTIAGAYDLNAFTASGGTLTLFDAGFITDSGGINLGSGTADHVGFQINAGAAYDIVAAGAGNMYTYNNGATLDALVLNNGMFEDTSGGGVQYAIGPLFSNNTTGTIFVSAGSTLNFSQGLVNDGTGTVDGVMILNGSTAAGGLQASTGHFGTMDIGSFGTLSITGPVSAKSTIDFSGTDSVLILNSPSLFAGTLDHFSAGDTIVVKHGLGNANVFIPGAGLLTLQNVVNGVTTQVLALSLQNEAGTLAYTGDGSGDTDIVAVPPATDFVEATHFPLTIDSLGFPTGTSVENFGNGTLWSLGSVPGALTDASIISSGGTLIVNASAEMHSLSEGSTTLDLQSGRLIIDSGGGWGDEIDQSGGVIESVTGLSLNVPVYNLGTGAVLQSDNATISVEGKVGAAGALIGPGAISFNAGTLSTVPGVVISVGTLAFGGSGTFDPYAGETLTDSVVFAASTMPLFGSPVTFNGFVRLNVTVPDRGTVVIGATADVSNFLMAGTGDVVTLLGTAIETSGDVSGNAGVPPSTIDISSGATWNIESDNGIFLQAGTGVLVNNGLLEKTGGAGVTKIDAHMTSNATLMVDTGTVSLPYGAIELAGTVGGGGVLQTGTASNNTTTTLDAGLFINVGSLIVGNTFLDGDQNYLGLFNSSQTLALQGHTFTLGNQAELSGFINGPGAVKLTRQGDVNGLTVQGSNATLDIAGTVTESANIALGSATTDHATLAVEAGKTFELMADVGVYGTLGGGLDVGTIANAGLFEKLGGIAGGVSAIQAALVNTGTVLVQHGNMVLQTAATNDAMIDVVGGLTLNAALGADAGQSGTIVLMPTGTLIANASIAASQTVTFDPGGLIAIGNSAVFAATILGFVPGDTIELTGATATNASYAGGVITLTNGATTLETLSAPGLANPAGLTVNTDGQGNSYLVELACFARGTRILTSTGEVAVEALCVGDLLPGLVSGGLRRVRWLGSREVDCAHHPEPAKVNPVRVRAGAFAPGVPSRDVLLSRDHALALDGNLIPVRHLIDGASIVQEHAASVTYWHIQLDAHDVVLADGLPAESYLDSGNRMVFEGGTTLQLHADFTRHVWEAGACLPLMCTGPAVATALAQMRRGREGRRSFLKKRTKKLLSV